MNLSVYCADQNHVRFSMYFSFSVLNAHFKKTSNPTNILADSSDTMLKISNILFVFFQFSESTFMTPFHIHVHQHKEIDIISHIPLTKSTLMDMIYPKNAYIRFEGVITNVCGS